MLKTLFILILIQFSISAFGQNKTLDRRALFLKAQEILPVVLATASDMALVNNDFSGEEMSTFFKIQKIVNNDFLTLRKDVLIFSDDKELFKLDTNQPPRTAVTSDLFSEPIYINLNVINDPKSNFELEDVLQILVHEYGHKISMKNQKIVDSVAAKIRNFLGPYIFREISSHGNSLTAFSAPLFYGSDSLIELLQKKSQVEMTILLNTVLFQNSVRVTDLSAEWAKTLLKFSTYKTKDSKYVQLAQNKFWSIGTENSFQNYDQFSFSIDHTEVANHHGRIGSGQDPMDQIRTNSRDLNFSFSIDPITSKFVDVKLKTDLVPIGNISAIGTLLQKSDKSWQVHVELQKPYEIQSAELFIEGKNEGLRIHASQVTSDHKKLTFNFENLEIPDGESFKIKSLILNGNGQLFLEKALILKSATNAPKTEKTRIQNFKIDSTGNPYLEIKLVTQKEIKAVKIGFRNDLSVLSEFVNVNKSNGSDLAKATADTVFSDYYLIELSETDFKQIKVNDGVVLQIPILSSNRNFQIGSNILARDDGSRSIFSISILDSAFDSVEVKLSTPIELKLPQETKNKMLLKYSFSLNNMTCSRALKD